MSEIQALLYGSPSSKDAFPLKHDCMCMYVHKHTEVVLYVCFYLFCKWKFVLCEQFPWNFPAGVVSTEDGDNDTLFWFLAQITVYSDSSVASRQDLFISVH